VKWWYRGCGVSWFDRLVPFFFYKQKTAYGFPACLVGSERCIRNRARALAVAARDLNLAEEDVTGPAVLALSRIQPDGLTALHLDYLNALASQSGGSAGKEALTTLLGLAPQQIKVAEQVLVSRGLVMLTGSGRRITPAGRDRVAKGNLITWQ